ncbi:phosphatidylglycerophosphatase A [Gluconacetobacter diazotrophicus PA1 5]|uniref:Phosphatidylglycerophosphatase A n=1 Tax=Gluconacetobacter diazotrophicus TaxID=33996 RepID=A0A7W4I6R0_GLUDI|nr:phosphatidylglycerophosphatase A [Gluconacetobacter diazotrophicus]ACI49975.1 phosphatidylglycerophosphatase A [Gluconacetobacter diazotrophicus PA1 5]MBB2157300.1 phosphatidylglycerophosphatase A [Gluconacetobacter diazotrophicus]TWB00717.1 phosphatidylglycerophosphatase A [Gluconacetobacter diazotrophicus]
MTPSRLIASFGGCGFSPFAPGTVGSLAALACGLGLLAHPLALAVAIVLCCAIGYVATARASGGVDHGWIVIDEVAGMWITMFPLSLPPTPVHPWTPDRIGVLWLVLAFALFRLFDITKPGPVGWFDRRHDAVGIMGDDIVAGLIGAFILAAIRCLIVMT